MIPYSFASTSHFVLTFSLSFTIVLGATILGFQKHGLAFFSLLVPAGCPLALLRAPCEGLNFIETLSGLLCIFDHYNYNDTYRGYSRHSKLTSYFVWEAEYKRVPWCGLPHRERYLNGSRYAEANEPDTYKRLKAADNILSRIYRYYYNNAREYGNRFSSCQKVVRSLYTKSPWIMGDEQAAKSTRTINVILTQPRDQTASTRHCLSTRRRSFHSSACTKENSINTPRVETLDSNQEKPTNKVKPRRVAKRVGVTTIARKLLEQNNSTNQKFFKVLNSIADPEFLIACYNEIKSKQGNMTEGIDKVTLDGINYNWFVRVAEELKRGTYKFKPNRRVEIPKSNGQVRPLGVGSPRDKIVQKALHAVLEAAFEPIFLPTSHGFRPSRSTHSALLRIYLTGNKHNWVIQGDITKCFDSIPHDIIMKRVSSLIGDKGFLNILRKFLGAGYVDPKTGRIIKTGFGALQGGILSPILSNITLHELDKYMDKSIKDFHKGTKRRWNPLYKSLLAKRGRSTSPVERQTLLRQMRTMRSVDSFDPNFRRMEYIRYADDFVILITGSLADANFIKNNVKDYLRVNCGLELNMDKTIISNLRTETWRFLGAEISKVNVKAGWLIKHGGKRIVGTPMLQINAPITSLIESLKKVGVVRHNWRKDVLPQGLTSMTNLSHNEIIRYFNSKTQGLLNYYSFASNKNGLHSIVWLLKASCALTLARKYKLRTLSKAFQKFGNNLACPETDVGLVDVGSLKATHEFKTDQVTRPEETINRVWSGKLTKSSFGLSCAICSSTTNLEMHHYRSIKDVRAKYRKGDIISFAEFRGALLRKQIPLCEYHHKLYHKGDLTAYELKKIANYRYTANIKGVYKTSEGE